MRCEVAFVIIFAVTFLVSEAEAELTVLGVKCGSKLCKFEEYCDFDNICRSCVSVCDQSHHNFQKTACEKGCQDYLHDIRYVRLDGTFGKGEDLQAEVKRLRVIAAVALTLTCLTLIIVISLVVLQFLKSKNITISSLRKKFSKKSNDKSSVNGIPPAPPGMVNKSDLRLEMPTTIGSRSENSPQTLTTNISRRPAEDSTLDYAYDNHAMSSSPSPNSKPHESNL